MRQPKSKKAQQTLEKMQERRTEDSICLREKIEERLRDLTAEKQKGINTIKTLKSNIEKIELQMLRIEGAIIGLSQIIVPPVLENDVAKIEKIKAD